MEQKDIEKILIECIESKIIEHNKEFHSIHADIDKEILLRKERIQAMLNFENKNYEMLKALCYLPDDDGRWRFMEGDFFGMAINYHRNWINNTRDLDPRLDKFKYIPVDYACISYEKFEEITGLNKKSVKKYLEIMETKNLIHKKRGLGGYFYKVLKT